MLAVKVEDVSYLYGQGTPFEKAAVEHVSLEIGQGEFIGVIGHTGSGKSTLMQHLNGLLRPTSGRVFIDGEDIWEKPAQIRKFRFKVGLVFQYPEYQLFEETVYKDIAFGPGNMGLSGEEIDQRVRQAAQFVGLPEEVLQQSPFELSGGQKRRVAIAGVIAMRPGVLILDEPTAGLDPRGRDLILQQIQDYHRQTGSTVLLVSHSMEDIANYAQRVLVMNRGRVFAFEGVDQIFGRGPELMQIGLLPPQVNRVFARLRQMGYPVRGDIYTVQAARDELLALLAKGAGQHA